jgi:hypothetical protein
VDDLFRHPPAHAAAAAARQGDTAALGALLAAASGDSRTLVLEGARRHLSRDAAVAWTTAAPRDAGAWLVRAATEVHLAGEARGHGMAESLTGAEVLDFRQLMADGSRSARRAAELAPDDPHPFWVLIQTCYARGADHLRDLLAELRRRDPWHLYGIDTTVDLLGEKWYGAADEARTLAEEVAADAPDGSLAPTVVPHAIREEWLYLAVFRKARQAASGFILSPETLASLDAARARSIGSAAHVPTPLTPYAVNTFALAYHLAGQRAVAKELLAPLGGLACEFPWGILGNAATVYAKAAKG